MNNDNRTVQIRIYECILQGQPYDDILEEVHQRVKKEEILRRIEKYRPIEARDMSSAHRARVTGLRKSTCMNFNKAFQRTCNSAATN
jgi:hypothetical protein